MLTLSRVPPPTPTLSAPAELLRYAMLVPMRGHGHALAPIVGCDATRGSADGGARPSDGARPS
jgi:hypothetical protein